MSIDLISLFSVAILLAFGALVQSLVGFGLAIVVAPLLLVIDPQHVPGTITFVALCLGLVNTWQYRSHLSIGGLSWAFIGRVPGTAVGGVILTVFSLKLIKVVLAVAVLSSVLLSVLRVSVQPSNRNMLIAGFFSGIMGTTTSVGGPPMALVLQNAKAHQLRANLAFYFVVSCLLSIATLLYTGHFGIIHIQYGAFALPFVFLASHLAYTIAERINPIWVKHSVLVLCSLAGIGLLIN
ncbi:sulfite exporter TauE/SafE family protein [Veronia pacifica]|uniref:Probable membrane transporter protein n=1 Tax=Veronia pacifica TaxID=1080227 RepID=A0A1C3EM42_9GAMM|nr:sulfite exporter TauE/SafE family protein [Veronia pacifica]ODA34294.1 hypothetical protein A8L45_07025 [Veronia pacifica]